MDWDVTMLGYRTDGPANLLLSFPLSVPPHMRSGIRELSQLSVEAGARGKGHASKLLDWVCREADQQRKVLLITPSAYRVLSNGCIDDYHNPATGGLDDAALISWYSRRGFVIIQQQPILMARQPRGGERVAGVCVIPGEASLTCTSN